MLANQRRQKIFDLLKEDGSAKVVRLAKIFKVTEVTIRQDLEKLEHEGLIIREHGGAFLKNMQDNVRSFIPLNTDNMDKKSAIGKKCTTKYIREVNNRDENAAATTRRTGGAYGYLWSPTG